MPYTVNITFLPALASDIEELTRVEIESKIKSVPECVADTEIDYALRLKSRKLYFNRPTTEGNGLLVLKAVLKGKIIGFLAGHLTAGKNTFAEIHSFYILKEHQRKGIGLGLFSGFVDYIGQHNAFNLCVGIAPENPYQSFYLKYGAQALDLHWLYWDNLPALSRKLGLPEPLDEAPTPVVTA